MERIDHSLLAARMYDRIWGDHLYNVKESAQMDF